jgi:hypothetical protein
MFSFPADAFFTKLGKRCNDIDSLLCVGLDPHAAQLKENTAEAGASHVGFPLPFPFLPFPAPPPLSCPALPFPVLLFLPSFPVVLTFALFL